MGFVQSVIDWKCKPESVQDGPSEGEETMLRRGRGNRTSVLDRQMAAGQHDRMEKLANWENCFPFEPRRDWQTLYSGRPLIAVLT